MTNSQSPLNDAHRDMFRRLGVSDELLKSYNGRIRSVTDAEARQACSIQGRFGQNMQGLFFERRDLVTGKHRGGRVRRDFPEEENAKPKDKYISSFGDRPCFFSGPGAWERLKDQESAVVLVESEKAQVSLTAWADRMQRKMVVFGMGGCWGYKGKIGRKLNSRGVLVDEKGFLRDLGCCDGRRVYVCLDSNVSTNRKVKGAQNVLVRELLRRNCDVFTCTLPIVDGANGPDDYVLHAGDEAMAAVFDKARAATETHDYGNGYFKISQKGIEHISNPDEEGETKPPVWLCAPLYIEAMTRDGKSESWGRLLEWTDSDDELHRRALPAELLRRDGGTEALCLLESEGLIVGRGKNVKDLLCTYISIWPTDFRALCVDRPGWATDSGGKPVYVLPDEAIGNSREPVVFQNPHSVQPAFSVNGTAEEWKDHVAAPVIGNSRPVFGISCAFSGPLLDVVDEPSGGFNMTGPTSIGKSTTEELASSVWGPPDKFKHNWHNTINGLEGIASISNDNVLVLDELAQVKPEQAGECAYMLANGQGRGRASRDGYARTRASWRLVFLSAGEVSLAQHMQPSGKKPTAGQEIRMAEFKADAGVGLGVLENLNAHKTSSEFIAALREATHKYYGAVGLEYVRHLVADRTQNPARLMEYLTKGIQKFVDYCAANYDGQIQRVARRFALVAVAGELATKYGLTGWKEGEATRAAGTCFVAWLNGFGIGGSREARNIVEHVRSFFEANGSSRFENAGVTTGNGSLIVAVFTANLTSSPKSTTKAV